MKNKIVYFLILSILFISCGNENHKRDNKGIGQVNNHYNSNNQSNKTITYESNGSLNNPNYISSSNNQTKYDVDESIRNLEQENQRIYEKQMRDIEKMKVGLNDFNSPKYKELEDNKRLREIMAENDRITRELNSIGNFKPYERPYVPDRVVLPNSTNYSNDYVNPNVNPVKVDVSGYQKNNGTYVEPHIRTAPNDRLSDNLRYPY